MERKMRRVIHMALLLAVTSFPESSRATDATIELGAGDGFVIQNNGGAIERLRVDEDTGNLSRNGALFVHTTGTSNTFVGVGAGNASTSSADNTAFGNAALSSVTSGSGNSAVGALSLVDNLGGDSNCALGAGALASNSSGSRNVAIGRDAGQNQTTGSDNVYLANPGTAGESGQIRIGTVGTHADTTIAGKVAIPSGEDVSLTGDGYLMMGLESGLNVALDNTELQARDNGGTSTLGVNAEGGNVVLGRLSPPGRVQVPWVNANADVQTDGSKFLFGITSSRRDKRNVEPFDDDYSKVLDLVPFTFEYLDQNGFPEGQFLGFMAEDVDERGMSYLVRYDVEGRPANINYDQMSVYVIGLLKQHQATLAKQSRRVEAQQRTIEAQRDQNAALQARLEQLESRVAALARGAER
jgi:hypothetical protein